MRQISTQNSTNQNEARMGWNRNWTNNRATNNNQRQNSNMVSRNGNHQFQNNNRMDRNTIPDSNMVRKVVRRMLTRILTN
uniref:Uncharacterized protein n=1 Tax=Acrobeloides nanus TaxID=290746 RepID=A0A914CU61_9BILA